MRERKSKEFDRKYRQRTEILNTFSDEIAAEAERVIESPPDPIENQNSMDISDTELEPPVSSIQDDPWIRKNNILPTWKYATPIHTEYRDDTIEINVSMNDMNIE